MKESISVNDLPKLGIIRAYVTYTEDATDDMSYVALRGSGTVTITAKDGGDVSRTASYGASHTYTLQSGSSSQWQVVKNRSYEAEISDKYNITYFKTTGTNPITTFKAEDFFDCVNLTDLTIKLVVQTPIETLLNHIAPFRENGSTLTIGNSSGSWTYNGSVLGSSSTFTFDGQGGWSKN